MPSCSHQHLSLLNIFVVMHSCLHGCPTSSAAKDSYRATQLGNVDQPQVFGGGPHASKRGRQSACYDHLQRCHIGWTLVTHHVSHCERLIHLQKNAFSVWCDQGINSLRHMGWMASVFPITNGTLPCKCQNNKNNHNM